MRLKRSTHCYAAHIKMLKMLRIAFKANGFQNVVNTARYLMKNYGKPI